MRHSESLGAKEPAALTQWVNQETLTNTAIRAGEAIGW